MSDLLESEKKKIASEIIRLQGFLAVNQLVQANAVSQRISGICRDSMVRDCVGQKPAMDHAFWKLERTNNIVHSMILQGEKDKAIEHSNKLLELL